MAGMMSIGGLISGMKTDEIITKVMEYARRPQEQMKAHKEKAQRQLTVWQDLNTRMLALKVKSDSVASTASFQTKTATSSDQTIVTATATSTALTGSYDITISKRAQNHQLASTGTYDSMNDTVGTGKLTITQANGSSFEVTVDNNNNTLVGLRDLINRQNKGVNASIVNTGTTAAPQYQMLLTAQNSGADYEMTVTTSDWVGGAPSFDQEVQVAQDAEIIIGSGANAITVNRSTNSVSDVIPGVTLNIIKADPGKNVRIDVTRNTEAVKTAIKDFVSQYNDLAKAIDDQFDYDTETGESGDLFGSYQLQAVQMDLASFVSGTVVGVDAKFSSLAAIGITQNFTGSLVIDDAELTAALGNNMNEVAKLFGSDLASESSYVSYVASTSDTKPSGTAGWQVEIERAARRAQVTAGEALPDGIGGLAQDEKLTVSGIDIQLTAGMELDDIIDEINRNTNKTNVVALRTGADGTGNGDYLTLRKIQYGGAYTFSALSSVSLTGGRTSGIGATLVSPELPQGEDTVTPGVGMTGLDVKGKINGEECTGTGQILSAKSTSTSDIKGLSLLITADTVIDPVKVTFTKGIGATLRDSILKMTSATGMVMTAQDSINTTISQIDEDIANMETRLLAQQDRLYIQFNSMESQLAKLQQQGSYIGAMLGNRNSSSK